MLHPTYLPNFFHDETGNTQIFCFCLMSCWSSERISPPIKAQSMNCSEPCMSFACYLHFIALFHCREMGAPGGSGRGGGAVGRVLTHQYLNDLEILPVFQAKQIWAISWQRDLSIVHLVFLQTCMCSQLVGSDLWLFVLRRKIKICISGFTSEKNWVWSVGIIILFYRSILCIFNFFFHHFSA